MELFLFGLAFPESPRWHEGALWFSDFYTQRVHRAPADGTLHTVVELDDQPSGLGWLPGGDLLLVSMKKRRLMRLRGSGLELHADLSAFIAWPCNDMVVAADGTAYVGNFGFDLAARAPFAPTLLLRVNASGEAGVAATDMHFPNGSVITPDGRTLVVAESYGQRLTAFDIAGDGSLHNRRVWAQFGGRTGPDGICMDAEGAIWLASPVSREVLRVKEGGAVTHRLETQDQAVACALGGADGRTLFVCTGKVMVTPQQSLAARTGKVWRVPVEVPHHAG